MDIDSDPTINDVESLPLPTQSVSISTPHEDPSIFKIPLQPNTSQSHNTQFNPPTTNYPYDFSSDQIFFADQSQKHIFQTPKHVPQSRKRSASAAPKNYKHFNKNVKVTKTVETTVKHCKCLCPKHDKIAKQTMNNLKRTGRSIFQTPILNSTHRKKLSITPEAIL
ncbi:hypothetical protein GcM3_221026 [Golovinomyces cichoracearum]|uniref:Uncharacterized protein n=1 Tax=Golovinomyces cichoracearum TaxID=62708 RepID=A0A420H6Q7_9PEZI|nr:hypothetical protein GcM3_221026 [Golovinomyces cichoracearum]